MWHPGMAGLTADRLGDAVPWKPKYDETQGGSAVELQQTPHDRDQGYQGHEQGHGSREMESL